MRPYFVHFLLGAFLLLVAAPEFVSARESICRWGTISMCGSLNTWDAEGVGEEPGVQGFKNIIYNNRDGYHSFLDTGSYWFQNALGGYEAMKVEVQGTGAEVNVRSGQDLVLGNASVVADLKPCATMSCFYYQTQQFMADIAYKHYRHANQHYVFPAHISSGSHYGFEANVANMPMVTSSMGASGSDINSMQAMMVTAASFKPDVFEKLRREGLLVPTLQKLFRWARVNGDPSKYLTMEAHPYVFDRGANAALMMEEAHNMRQSSIPPMVQMKVMAHEFTEAGPAISANSQLSSVFHITPASISVIHRGYAQKKSMEIDLGESFDINNKPLQYHTVVMEGNNLEITKLNESGSRIRITETWQQYRRETFDRWWTFKSLVGFFVSVESGDPSKPGRIYSTPGFLTINNVGNQERTYAPDGRLLQIKYANWGSNPPTYYDKPKDWATDTFIYRDGNLQGWIRDKNGDGNTLSKFTAEGHLVTAQDAQGKVTHASRVLYGYTHDNPFSGVPGVNSIAQTDPPQPYTGTSYLPAGSVAANPGTASFVSADTARGGSWKGVYGQDGYAIVGDSTNYPAYATVTINGVPQHVWNNATTEPRALQKANANDRVAGAWYGNSITMNVNIRDEQTHRLGLYTLDWDGSDSRSERVEIFDADSNTLLDSRVISNFSAGAYHFWNISGHVRIVVTALSNNAVVSGLFFDPTGAVSTPAPTPTPTPTPSPTPTPTPTLAPTPTPTATPIPTAVPTPTPTATPVVTPTPTPTPPNAEGLVGLWKFDEAANDTCSGGQDTCDSSGYNHHGSVNGNGGANTSGPAITDTKPTLTFANSKARFFDGQDDHVTIGDIPAANFERTNAFSGAAWIQTTSTAPLAQTIMAKGHDSGAYQGWNFQLYHRATNTSTALSLFLINNATNNIIEVNSGSSTISANQWQHVAFTYDGSSKAAGVKFYINGILQTNTVVADTLSSSIQQAIPLKIGDRGDGAAFQPFLGYMDDVRTYNRVLSNTEVAQLAIHTTPSTTPQPTPTPTFAPTAAPTNAAPAITVTSTAAKVNNTYQVRIGQKLTLTTTAADPDSSSVTLAVSNLTSFIGAVFSALAGGQ